MSSSLLHFLGAARSFSFSSCPRGLEHAIEQHGALSAETEMGCAWQAQWKGKRG